MNRQIPLDVHVFAKLKSCGFADAKLVHQSYSPESFGNAVALFHVGKLALYFIRDRGQDLLEIGSVDEPDRPYDYHFISVALGLRPLELTPDDTDIQTLDFMLIEIRKEFTRIEAMFTDPESAARLQDVIDENTQLWRKKAENHKAKLRDDD